MSVEAAFHASLLDARAPIPPGLIDGAGRPAGRRFAVYRNNVAVALTDAIETAFPAITSLIGPENMARVAGSYIRADLPRTPVLSQYGAGFPDFLAASAPLAHLPYLADVARIDLAMRRSYHAADHTPLPRDALAQLDATCLMATRLMLAPSVQLLSSPWPILQIWRFATRQTTEKPTGGPQDVVILRAGFDPEPHALGPGAHAFLCALQAGHPLARAIEAADPDFDLSATLTLLFAQNGLAAPPP
ncbi:HvfC/BufC family peptide modification chaperone [Roseivivax sp. CAU 1753]